MSANPFETIANLDPNALYSGAIAETTIHALQAANRAKMTLEDLRNYTVPIKNLCKLTTGDIKSPAPTLLEVGLQMVAMTTPIVFDAGTGMKAI